MKKDECFFLGWISKTNGLKGHLTLSLDTDHPDHYVSLDALFLDVGGELVPFFVDSFQLLPSGKAKIKLEDINSIEQAKGLTGKEVHLPLSALPKLEEGQFYYHELEGVEVMDKEFGLVGRVKWVEEGGAQPLLVVDRSGIEIMVPMVDHTIGRYDRSEKVLHMNFPEGLIDMYLEQD